VFQVNLIVTSLLKGYFLIIISLASILGSTVSVPYISDFIGAPSSDLPRVTPIASAQSLPHRVDHHVEIKERTGDTARVEEWINDADRNCEMSCTFVQFTPGRQGKTGIAYVGDNPMDLSGAKRVHFFLMGDKGGEMVKVYVVGKNPSSPQSANNSSRADSDFNEKFARSTGVITLTNDWQRYEISLEGVDLTGITAPFAIELFRRNNTSAMQGVYFKFIEYENQAVDPRFAIAANSADNATALAADNATALAADNATALAADNATDPNNNGIRGNNNNGTRDQSDENLGGNNTGGSRGRNNASTAAGPTEVGDNNVVSESPINDTTGGGTQDEQIGNTTSNVPLEGQDNENLAPTAMPAVSSLVAQAGDIVILDGSMSSDPDGDIITYQWSQSDGPSSDIQGADTVAPTITIPDIDSDGQIIIDLVVNDGQAQSNIASVVIDVQYVEEIEETIQQALLPNNARQTVGWSDASCDGNGASIIVECLTDSSDSTFVSSDRPSEATDTLFSFQDPSSVGVNASNQIVYVTAQVTAKKTGASGFTSFIVDDPSINEHYSTPGISITSNSFEEYSFTWKSDPITGQPWALDSLNSLVAGYRYLAGQGSIEISEFSLMVTTVTSQEESDEVEEPSSLPVGPPTNEEDGTVEEEEPSEEEPSEEEPSEEEPSEEEPSEEEPSEENVQADANMEADETDDESED
jgi:hypothetical protein